MEYANMVVAWIQAHSAQGGFAFGVWIGLTILGTGVDAAEKIIAATPATSDDADLAALEAKTYAKIILACVRPFSVISHLQPSGPAAPAPTEKTQ